MTKKRTHLSGDIRREQILDVATALFIERGFESVKTADIAEQLDISRPHIYTYFPSTEAVFESALERHTNVYLDDLDAALALNPMMDVTTLFELIIKHREFLLLLNSASLPMLSAQRDRAIRTMSEYTEEFLKPFITSDNEEEFRALNLLLRSLLLEAARIVVTAPSESNPKVLGKLMQTMLDASFAQVMPTVGEYWKSKGDNPQSLIQPS